MHSDKKITVHCCYELNCGGETVATQKVIENLKGKTAFFVTESVSSNLQASNLLYFLNWIVKSTFAHYKSIKKQKKINILYATTFTGVLGFLLTQNFKQKRIIYHYHGSRIPQKPYFEWNKKYFIQEFKYQLSYLLHSMVFAKTDILIFPSTEAKSTLTFLFPNIKNMRTKIIANGYDKREFHPISVESKIRIRNNLQLPPKAVVFLISGRIEPQKNIFHAIKIFQKLRRKQDLFLLLCFPRPSNKTEVAYLAYLHRYVAQLNHQHSVLFIEDAYEQYQASEIIGCADCVISFSATEVYPLSMIEAFACKVPYFTTNTSISKLYIQLKKEGLVTWKEVANKIASIILELM